MLFRMSIFLACLMAWIYAPIAAADGMSQCAGLSLKWRCDQGTPILSAERNARDVDRLEYRLLSAGKLAALGKKLIAVNFSPSERITVVGLSPQDGPCCVSQLTAPPAPQCTIDAPKPPDEVPIDPIDFAVSLDLSPSCPLGADGNLCRGSASVQQISGPVDQSALPVSVTITGAGASKVTASGAAACYGAGPSQGFCQALAPSRISLAIQTPASFSKRSAEVCVSLTPPSDEGAQIRMVQTALTGLGFGPGPIDGQAGPATLEAVKTLAAQLKLTTINSALDPAFLAALGLGPFGDFVAANNQACQTVTLPAKPRPSCERATTRAQGARCLCRYENMTRLSSTRCGCAKGYRFVPGRGCFEVLDESPPRPRCDPDTTIARGGECVCRFKNMRPISDVKCGCIAGKDCG